MSTYIQGDYKIQISGGVLSITPLVNNGADIVSFGIAGANITIKRSEFTGGRVPPVLSALIPASHNYGECVLASNMVDFSAGAIYEYYDGSDTVAVALPIGGAGSIKKKQLSNYKRFVRASVDEHSFIEDAGHVASIKYPYKISNINKTHKKVYGKIADEAVFLDPKTGKFEPISDVIEALAKGKPSPVIKNINDAIADLISQQSQWGNKVKAIDFIGEDFVDGEFVKSTMVHVKFNNGRTAYVTTAGKALAVLSDYKRVVRLESTTDAVQATPMMSVGDNGMLAYGAGSVDIDERIERYAQDIDDEETLVVYGGMVRFSGAGGSMSRGARLAGATLQNKMSKGSCEKAKFLPSNIILEMTKALSNVSVVNTTVTAPKVTIKMPSKETAEASISIPSYPINNNTSELLIATSPQKRAILYDNGEEETKKISILYYKPIQEKTKAGTIMLLDVFTPDGGEVLDDDTESSEKPKIIASGNIQTHSNVSKTGGWCSTREYAPAIK